MPEPHDPNRTVAVPSTPGGDEPHDPGHTVDRSSAPADSLDAGLAAGFAAPHSSLGDMRPVLLKEAEGESAHVVKPSSDAMPSPEQTGDRYQLFGEIARGGMGAVLRGRDLDLGRDLAIKVLLKKHTHRPEVARRFLEEAQIGGQLQHPGVVPVYDIGRFGQRPFFTMKLVKGQTLAALLDERPDPGADRPRFLGIALQVAQALAYAHAKGVIHRDLKPANVMVGAFGEVQVMDWGLAKVLAEGGVADEERASRERAEAVSVVRTARSSGSVFGTETEAGSLLGTPAYMPPEQANGDVANLGRRSDVFGLGAILCEVLTGKPPYVGRSAEEVRRKACNGDLADATARLDGCGADHELTALTKRCLAPEAIDRPTDAQMVADSLTAYLDGVQERLHQAELAEAQARARAIEERKRRRLTLALAATVLLAVTLGGGGWLWVKADRDARQAQLTRDVNDALNRATTLREQAKSAKAGGPALFAQAREQVQRALALVETGPADAALLEQVRGLQAELNEEEKDRKLLAGLDAARLAQAETMAGKNRFAFERSVPLFREAFQEYGLPAGEGEPAAAAAHIRQRPAQVREARLAALAQWIDLAANPDLSITEPHRDWLRAVLVAAEPSDGWTRRFRAACSEKDEATKRAALEKLAAEADVRKLPARSLTALANRLLLAQARRSAVQLLRRTQRQYPADFWANHNLGMALRIVTPPQRKEAVRYLSAAVALRPDSPGAHLNLGLVLSEQGRYDEALACFRKAIELDSKYAQAHNNLGITLKEKGLLDEAIASYRRALTLDPRNAYAHTNLGVALKDRGQIDAAVASCRKAVELSPKDARTHLNLGAVLLARGRLDEAIACDRKAIELNPKDAQAHNNLGQALKAKGRVDEAIASFRQAIELDPNLARARQNLGAALEDRGRLDEALACHRKAVEVDPRDANAHNHLGTALAKSGRLDEALGCFRQALALDPRNVPALTSLGQALDGKGQRDEAIANYRKAITLDPKYARAHNNLGATLEARGRLDEAIACYRQAGALDPKDAIAHDNLGVALAKKGQENEAIACFRRALESDPKYARAHFNLGNALQRKGRLDGAIACYRKALRLDPRHASAHTSLGAALASKGRLSEAIACFRKAAELVPKDHLALCYLGNALADDGRVDEADRLLPQGRRAGPRVRLRPPSPGRRPVRHKARLRRRGRLLPPGDRARPAEPLGPPQPGHRAQGQGPAGRGPPSFPQGGRDRSDQQPPAEESVRRRAGGRGPRPAPRLPRRHLDAGGQRRAPWAGLVVPAREALPRRGGPVRRRLRRRPRPGRGPALRARAGASSIRGS
jgi:serine/threonine-protein kinase